MIYTMTRKLDGNIALITRGSRGIGAAIAKRLAADGARVASTYSKGADAAAAVVTEIERDGGKAIAIQADATDAEAGKAAVEKTVATFGRLDVLFFFQAEDGIRAGHVTGVQTCALPILALFEDDKRHPHLQVALIVLEQRQVSQRRHFPV